MNKEEMRQNIAEYSELHKRFNPLKDTQKEDSDIVNHIHSDLDTMSLDEKIKLLNKISQEEFFDKQLLKYELKHYHPKKHHFKNDTELIEYVIGVLDRYQWKTGGMYIEDDQWTISKDTEDTSDIIFQNTIDIRDGYDNDTMNFMKSIVRILNESTGFETTFNIKEHKEHSISRVYINITKN